MNSFYSYVLLPLAEAAFSIAAMWDEKARAAVEGRRDWADKLRLQLEKAPAGPRILMHAPSVGEFLQGRAVLDRILDGRPEMVAVVTHFSPSAEKIVEAYKRAAAYGYLPLDTPRNVKLLLEIINPALIVFSRADVWPNLIEEASSRGIPAALIAGSLSDDNKLLTGLTSARFKRLKFIGAVYEDDAARFRELGVEPGIISVTGDPRYDQTWDRARAVEPADTLFAPFPKEGWTFVAGSTWPQDEKAIVPAFAEVRKKHPEARMILVPHEPVPNRIQSIKKSLAAFGLESSTLSELEASGKKGAPVILVDRVGILAKLYLLGKAAFVGGSFVRRVHNVMEPACFGLPVIVGPKHKNSHEATRMIAAGGCFPAEDQKAVTYLLLKFIEDEDARNEAGQAAMKLVESQRGAASRTLDALRNKFPSLKGT